MDLHSGNRAAPWNASPRNGSRLVSRNITMSKDEVPQLCTRIGCSGRLNHTTLPRPKSSRPTPRSSPTKEVVTSVKKPIPESRKKVSTRSETSSTSSSSISGDSVIHKLKPKSRDMGSTKVVSKPVNTNARTVYGQRSGIANQDGQSGTVDSGRRRTAVTKKSTVGETSSSVRTNKARVPSSDERSSITDPRHSRNSTASVGSSGFPLVRSRRPVSLRGNNPSPTESTRMTPDNVDAIANLLLALERIDQNEGLTFEQILYMEGNSLLDGFNLYDQHREMRLDIDHMSYEELLALEEEIGIVSTALSEEELSKCVRTSLYEPLHMKKSRMRGEWCMDDTKCSICQEEFIPGDEIGRVGCDHGYHADCINQWLRMKNWCPICKSLAKPSDST